MHHLDRSVRRRQSLRSNGQPPTFSSTPFLHTSTPSCLLATPWYCMVSNCVHWHVFTSSQKPSMGPSIQSNSLRSRSDICDPGRPRSRPDSSHSFCVLEFGIAAEQKAEGISFIPSSFGLDLEATERRPSDRGVSACLSSPCCALLIGLWRTNAPRLSPRCKRLHKRHSGWC